MIGKVLFVIVGPTAVGKTELCIKLAQHFKTSIISADSRQFYKEISIGTAKPTEEELSKARHYFINSHSLSQEYNAGEYEEDALELIGALFKSYDYLILTGGSGLFIKAITDGFDTFPEVDLNIREKLNQQFEQGEFDILLKELELSDPHYFNEVDKSNYRRVIRALEITRQTNKPYSSFRTGESKIRPFKIIKVGLERSRDELYERIDRRVDIMLNQGLLEEVKSVYSLKEKTALQTVGYSEIFNFLDGKYDWEEAVRLIKRNSRRYAKRQLTWFKKDEEIHWFHPEHVNDIIGYLKNDLPVISNR